MGHEVAVSAIQLATAFSAIANDGYLVRPYIVEQIVQSNNKIKMQNDIRFKRQIADENIMKEIKKMLRQVVTGGTGVENTLMINSFLISLDFFLSVTHKFYRQ
jgi:cell division protein FtsI/penicillin-binding protein 2